MLRVGVVLLGLALVACDGDTVTLEGNHFPVGSETDAIFDAGLIGSWRTPANASGADSELHIRSDDLRSYHLRLREKGDDEAVEMSGYVVDVQGAKYLNCKLEARQSVVLTGWVLYRYWFDAPNRLVVADVDDAAFKGCDLSSAAAAYNCLRQHPLDPKVFEDTITYERVSLVATQPNNGLQRTAGARVRVRRTGTSARRR